MKRYYTVDIIAKMLSMHPKTIQRYIREGKLHAKKVGKSWQVQEQDLRNFMESSDIHDDGFFSNSAATVASSVVDINVKDSEDAFDFEKYLMTLMNSREYDENRSSMHTQYLESENKLRITLWGDVTFMQNIFETLSVLIKNKEMENEK